MRKLFLFLFVQTVFAQGAQPLSVAALDLLLGREVKADVQKWEHTTTNLTSIPVYKVSPMLCNDEFLRLWAKHFDVSGPISELPADFDNAPGNWIMEPSRETPLKYRTVYYSLKDKEIVYATGDDGWRWDLKKKESLVKGVPTRAEAISAAETMLPRLGLNRDLFVTEENQLKVYESYGKFRYHAKTSKEVNPVEVVRMRKVSFVQRLPVGELMSVGGLGLFSISFVSDRKVAEVEGALLEIKGITSFSAANQTLIMKRVAQGGARSRTLVPPKIVVNKCTLVYPASNSGLEQAWLWPFYQLNFKGSDGKEGVLFVPAWAS